MADDLLAQLMAQQSLINSAQAGGKCAPILMGLADVNMGAAFSLQGRGFNSDKTAPVLSCGRPKGLADKMFAAVQSIVEELKKISQGGASMSAAVHLPTGTAVAPNVAPMPGDGPTMST